MTDVIKLFDSYNRKARLYPALLTLLPLLATILGWFAEEAKAASSLVAIAISCGALYALTSVSRSAGRLVEKRLLIEWGGWPTTLHLRHADQTLSAPTKARYHAFLQANVPQCQMPTDAQEAADPSGADAIYKSAVDWLKEQRRGDEYKLIHKENAEYGFRRNLRGSRPFGISLAVLSTIVWWIIYLGKSGPLAFEYSRSGLRFFLSGAPVSAWVALSFALLIVPIWQFIVSDGWVREAANNYSRAMLASCDNKI